MEFNFTKDYQIKVTSFWYNGAWYDTTLTDLTDEHRKLAGYELSDLIRRNDESVKDYSGVRDGFDSSLNYTIEVNYPIISGKFCCFALVNG